MLYQITSYIKFIVKSTNQHGVHSPFVYDLITKCFYDKKKYTQYNTIKHYKKYLLENKTFINVLDLGSGSRVFKSKKRLVSKMASNAGSTTKETRLLFRLTNYFQFKNSLELGTSLGIATHAIHIGNTANTLLTIEGCPNISKFTQNTFKTFSLKNVTLKTGDFLEVLNQGNKTTYDFIYFDGNHQKEATLNYFETLIPTTNNDSMFIFDDIYWSKGMTEAWELIKKHPKVTVSIDLFFWGIVFFREEQVKEHFTIRV